MQLRIITQPTRKEGRYGRRVSWSYLKEASLNQGSTLWNQNLLKLRGNQLGLKVRGESTRDNLQWRWTFWMSVEVERKRKKRKKKRKKRKIKENKILYYTGTTLGSFVRQASFLASVSYPIVWVPPDRVRSTPIEQLSGAKQVSDKQRTQALQVPLLDIKFPPGMILTPKNFQIEPTSSLEHKLDIFLNFRHDTKISISSQNFQISP